MKADGSDRSDPRNQLPSRTSLAESFPSRLRPLLLSSLIGVALVALVVRIPHFGTSLTAPDSEYYLTIAHGIFHGSGYLSDLRPPAYPTLLAIFELFGADPGNAVVFLQNCIGVAFPCLVLLVGWRFFSPAVGILAGFLTAASPLAIAIEQFVLTDYLFSVLLFVAAALLAEAILRLQASRKAGRLLIAAGAVFGFATLFRANGLYGIVVIPLAILAWGPRWKPGFRASAIAVAALLVVIAPWVIHNVVRFGDLNVASEGGLSLYGRAIGYDQVAPADDTPNSELARQIYDSADPNEQEAAVAATAGVLDALIKEDGKDTDEATGAMGELAKNAILNQPGTYLRDTLQILGRYQGAYFPRTFTGSPGHDQIGLATAYLTALDPSHPDPPVGSPLTQDPWRLAQGVTQLLFILTIGGLLLLVLPFLGDPTSRSAGTTFLIVGLLGIVGVALTARFELRHAVVFAPFVWILAPASVDVAVRAIAARLPAHPRLRTRHAES